MMLSVKQNITNDSHLFITRDVFVFCFFTLFGVLKVPVSFKWQKTNKQCFTIKLKYLIFLYMLMSSAECIIICV